MVGQSEERNEFRWLTSNQSPELAETARDSAKPLSGALQLVPTPSQGRATSPCYFPHQLLSSFLSLRIATLKTRRACNSPIRRTYSKERTSDKLNTSTSAFLFVETFEIFFPSPFPLTAPFDVLRFPIFTLDTQYITSSLSRKDQQLLDQSPLIPLFVFPFSSPPPYVRLFFPLNVNFSSWQVCVLW